MESGGGARAATETMGARDGGSRRLGAPAREARRPCHDEPHEGNPSRTPESSPKSDWTCSGAGRSGRTRSRGVKSSPIPDWVLSSCSDSDAIRVQSLALALARLGCFAARV